MVKVDVFAYPAFHEYDPIYAKIWRPKEMILDSINRTPFMYKRKHDWSSIIDKHHELMSKIDGPDIDAERVFSGDHSQIDHVASLL